MHSLVLVLVPFHTISAVPMVPYTRCNYRGYFTPRAPQSLTDVDVDPKPNQSQPAHSFPGVPS